MVYGWYKYVWCTLFLCLIALSGDAQIMQHWKASFFGEMYYAYNMESPNNHESNQLVYNYKRHNELAINFALVQLAYQHQRTKINIGLMAGNYAQYNLASEPYWAQHIYECNAGLAMNAQQTLWLEAGIFTSHIGFESPISSDCWHLSRSITADNTPYYESGVRLQYAHPKKNIKASVLALNGWQRIQKPTDIQRPSWGAQINYRKQAHTLNYSMFYGSDAPDSVLQTRLYHNLYWFYEPKGKHHCMLGIDLGQSIFGNSYNKYWYTTMFSYRYLLHKKLKIAARAEYVNDPNHAYFTTKQAIQMMALSSNLDYLPYEHVMIRFECKYLKNTTPYFAYQQRQNTVFAVAANIRLQ